MDHNTASSAELAVDHGFIQWVKHPNEESTLYWKNWLENNPDKAEVIADARRLVLLLSQEEEEDDSDELDNIWAKLTNKKFISVAAAVLTLIVSGIIFFQFNNKRMVEYATNFGEKRTIHLPDSSIITLNANSIVTMPAKWSENSPREVQLKGEAYFSVTHKVNKQKFLVRTPEGVQVEVLGTEFNVSSRGKDSKVVLASGKIRLHIDPDNENKQLDMHPGEMVTVTTDAKITRKQVKPALYTSWKEDKVYFDDYTLAEVATMLEQTYGYKVVFRDTALSNQKITAFLEVKGLEDILTTISETFEVDITRQNNQIIISSL
jgi:ferric-dicitrate binding protein FerR (iron transport regulator)